MTRKPKTNTRIVVTIPVKLKTRLDAVQRLGYTLSGFVRVAVETALQRLENERKAADR